MAITPNDAYAFYSYGFTDDKRTMFNVDVEPFETYMERISDAFSRIVQHCFKNDVDGFRRMVDLHPASVKCADDWLAKVFQKNFFRFHSAATTNPHAKDLFRHFKRIGLTHGYSFIKFGYKRGNEEVQFAIATYPYDTFEDRLVSMARAVADKLEWDGYAPRDSESDRDFIKRALGSYFLLYNGYRGVAMPGDPVLEMYDNKLRFILDLGSTVNYMFTQRSFEVSTSPENTFVCRCKQHAMNIVSLATAHTPGAKFLHRRAGEDGERYIERVVMKRLFFTGATGIYKHMFEGKRQLVAPPSSTDMMRERELADAMMAALIAEEDAEKKRKKKKIALKPVKLVVARAVPVPEPVAPAPVVALLAPVAIEEVNLGGMTLVESRRDRREKKKTQPKQVEEPLVVLTPKALPPLPLDVKLQLVEWMHDDEQIKGDMPQFLARFCQERQKNRDLQTERIALLHHLSACQQFIQQTQHRQY